MSGVEAAAGLALAILPLLVSAAEHYDDCLRPFHRFKNFAEEVRRYLQLLGIQKSIFRGQCRLLLQHVNLEHATAMMAQADHPFWSDERLEDDIGNVLGDSKDECVSIIEMMQEELQGIEAESQKLLATANQRPQVSMVNLKSSGTIR